MEKEIPWTASSRRCGLPKTEGRCTCRIQGGTGRLRLPYSYTTTLLAQQHYETFSERFSRLP